MDFKERIKQVGKYWFLIAFIFGAGAWVTISESTLAKNSGDIVDLKTIVQQNQQIIMNMQSQYELLLQLYLNISGDTVKQWRDIPRKMPRDSTGTPIKNKIWLEVSDDSMSAAFYKLTDSGTVIEKELWDIKK